MRVRSLLSAVLAGSSYTALVASDATKNEIVEIGPGVTPPHLVSKLEPRYTRAAEEAHIQGSLLLQIVIDRYGIPRDLSVLSPIGFGLDEQAIECVGKWRFQAATKESHPVNTRAQVEVRFRLLGVSFDQKAEERRTRFNRIMSGLQKDPAAGPTERDVSDMKDLSDHKLPGAQYVLGFWQLTGTSPVQKDEAAGLELLEKAAAKNYGPAIFFVGQSKWEGRFLPKDPKAGLTMMQTAAILGSNQAQLILANMYEAGKGVEVNTDRAKRYLRLCAAAGTAECQYRLGSLLLRSHNETGTDLVQAVAWLELANEHKYAAAATVADSEAAKLTAEQSKLVARLKPQLERRP